jgi:hypothetical protein
MVRHGCSKIGEALCRDCRIDIQKGEGEPVARIEGEGPTERVMSACSMADPHFIAKATLQPSDGRPSSRLPISASPAVSSAHLVNGLAVAA